MDNFHKLIEGFHNFKQTYFLKERQYFESLEKAQNPKTLVVAWRRAYFLLKAAEIADGQQTVIESSVLFVQLLWNLKFL